MGGFDAVYVPGWDCHGLPIEHNVEKELGSRKKEMSQAEIRKHCRTYAEKFIDIQRDEFKRLGVQGDWEEPYLTMNYPYEANHRQGVLQIRLERQSFSQQESRSTGAAAARRHWPRLRLNIKTIHRPRSS